MIRRPVRRFGTEEGMSLLEVVLAISLLAGTFLALSRATASGLMSVHGARASSSYLELANAELESLRALPFAELGVATTDPDLGTAYPGNRHDGRTPVLLPATPAPPTAVTEVEDGEVSDVPAHTVRRWVTWSSFDGTAGPKHLEVRVEWSQNGRTRQVSLDSLVYPGGAGPAEAPSVPQPSLVVTPATGTAPLVVAFDATGSTPGEGGAISTYAWRFGDGATATTSSATTSHTYTAAGNYTAVLAVTDASGRSASTSKTIAVTAPQASNRPPVASFTASPGSGNAPILVSADASGSSDPDGDALTYTWSWGDGTANSTGVAATHTYTSAGTFTITLTVRDSAGATATAARTVTAATATCAIESASFRNPSSNGVANDILVRNNNRAEASGFVFTVRTNTACQRMSAYLPTASDPWVVSLTLQSTVNGVRVWEGTGSYTSAFNRGTGQTGAAFDPQNTSNYRTFSFSVHR